MLKCLQELRTKTLQLGYYNCRGFPQMIHFVFNIFKPTAIKVGLLCPDVLRC